MRVAICALAALALFLGAGVQETRPKLASIPTLNQEITLGSVSTKDELAAMSDQGRSTKRLGFGERYDRIEGTRFENLSIVKREELSLVRSTISMETEHWAFTKKTELDGSVSLGVGYSVYSSSGLGSLRCRAPFVKDTFELVFRNAGRVSRIKASSAERGELRDGAVDEYVYFQLTPETILDIADAGAMRLGYGMKSTDFVLAQCDQDALRWLVWEKMPGGKELMRSRYDIVEAKK